MLQVYRSNGRIVQKANLLENDVWINLVKPTKEELEAVISSTNVFTDFLFASLDPEEVSRIDIEEEQVLILTNASFREIDEREHLLYTTVPLGIILLEDKIITVSNEPLECIEHFISNRVKEFDISKKTRFTLQIMYLMTSVYLSDLRKMDVATDELEMFLHENLENDYLVRLLALEKNLVYFSTAIKRNESVVKKIIRSSYIKKYDDDSDLLEDTLIEIQQAIEMAEVNSKIVRSIRDAFASIINNNLNTVMKALAGITIVLTICTTVFSFFGMNTALGSFTHNGWFTVSILVFTLGLTIISIAYMRKKKMF